jgi:hypothetical protein
MNTTELQNNGFWDRSYQFVSATKPWGWRNEGLHHKLRNATSSHCDACQPLHDANIVLWVAGPPGAGKSTITAQSTVYEFSAKDRENLPCQFDNFTRMHWFSEQALYRKSSAYVIGACASESLTRAPQHVM